jgi:hypothetical protein
MRSWALLIGLTVFAGCSAKTETGYDPRRLGDSEAVQRGYYAAPFSPEARQAEFERQSDFSSRRPTDYRP